MKIAFLIWGILGLLGNVLNFLDIEIPYNHPTGVGVGTSSYMGTIALIWIGGMLFFALGSLLFPPRAQAAQAAPPVAPIAPAPTPPTPDYGPDFNDLSSAEQRRIMRNFPRPA